MTAIRIRGPELSAAARVEFAFPVDGFEFRMALQWLGRVEMWMFQMFGPSGERIIDGLRVVNGTPLLIPFSDIRLPPGHLVVHDTTNTQVDPGRADFRKRHIVVLVDKVPQVDDFVISVGEQPLEVE